MSIREQIQVLRERLAHPRAVGSAGIFSGGHSLPYPGIGQNIYGRHTVIDEPPADPDALVPDWPVRKAGKEREERATRWSQVFQSLKKRRRRGRSQ